MGLRDLKIPKMKFKKMKMENVAEELDKIDYEKMEKKNIKKRTTPLGTGHIIKQLKNFFMRHQKNILIIHVY